MENNTANTETAAWINPYTGRAMGALLDDIVRKLKTVQVEDVQDLQFLSVDDHLQHDWKMWLVEFTYQGRTCQGYMQAGFPEPSLFHDTEIELAD